LRPELSQSPIFTIPRKRFVLRCDGYRGSVRVFLGPNHDPTGQPIRLVSSPEAAFHFVELLTAVRRGRALLQLGWRDLRVIEICLP
jgi:hypothetical protein